MALEEFRAVMIAERRAVALGAVTKAEPRAAANKDLRSNRPACNSHNLT